MIAFIVSRLFALIRLELTGTATLAPRLLILKSIVRNTPIVKKAIKLLRFTPGRFARLIETGKLEDTLYRALKKHPKRTRKALRIINKFLKDEGKKEIKNIPELQTPAKKILKNKKLRRSYKNALKAYGDQSSSGGGGGGSGGGGGTPEKEYVTNKGRTNVRNGIIRTVFLSTWTFEGIYNINTKHCMLFHSGKKTQKWYSYPRFPYSWYKQMAEAPSPGGNGAGSVWWDTYASRRASRRRPRGG